ncbi:hypothetical protein V6N13_055402 [Hibiscus sabdariffa]|uniref:Secreted protein n=1 Tax=Hibiscus sabdariffa TaxID=183260 RepID=A0ABR2BL87_9ROSI
MVVEVFPLRWIDWYLYLCLLLVLLQCTSPICPALCKPRSSLATWPASATGSSSCSGRWVSVPRCSSSVTYTVYPFAIFPQSWKKFYDFLLEN